MANCTPPNDFLKNRGLFVKNKTIPPTVTLMDPTSTPNSGAAYVVISAGESGGGAYLSSGQLGASTVGDGDGEKLNWADQDVAIVGGIVTTYFVDDSTSDVADANHFDDTVSRPSVLSVITKAALGPRPH
jgi:hypothetical protein